MRCLKPALRGRNPQVEYFEVLVLREGGDFDPAWMLEVYSQWKYLPSFPTGCRLSLILIASTDVWYRAGARPKPRLSRRNRLLAFTLILPAGATAKLPTPGVGIQEDRFTLFEYDELEASS